MSEPVDWSQEIERHKELLANGEHLFSGLRFRDLPVPEGVDADAVMELEIDPTVTNPTGALQGGLVATFADIVGGRMAMEGLDPHSIVVTSDLTVHYLGPVRNGPAHARGHILRRGKRAVVTRVDIYDGADGPLAAACQLAFTIVRPTATT
ncbi:MAG: PaaI family thioesterase [Acidimicrobiales bacterium]